MFEKLEIHHLSIDSNIYKGAEMYAKLHNVSLRQLVENFLSKCLASDKNERQSSLSLPPHLERLGGCLADIDDATDDKYNYLMDKYK